MKEFGDERGFMDWTLEMPTRSRKDRVIKLPPVPESNWMPPGEWPSLASAKHISLDIETYDPDLRSKGPGVRRDGRIIGISLGTDEGFRGYFPIGHESGNLDRSFVLGYLSQELSREHQVKVGANLLYDLDYLTHAGVKIRGKFHDVQIAEPLLDEEADSYSLESLAQKHLGEGKVTDQLENWLKRAGLEKNWKSHIWRAPPSLVGPYAEGDADLPLRILAIQKGLLAAEHMTDLFDLESRMIPLLLAMRQRGVRVDILRAEQLRDHCLVRQKEAEEKLKHIAGTHIEVWAAESIAKAFDKAGYDYPITPKSKKPSFTKGWLEHHGSELASAIVAVRKYDKFRSTFVEGYILDGHINGRIHCQFNQLRSDEDGTVSGRLSSSNPNLQNIPMRDDELGPMIRSLFIPEDGEDWHCIDYSQIEYKLIVASAAALKLPMAMETVEQYKREPKTDFHDFVANITGLGRKHAKNISFGVAYGQGMVTLAAALGVEIGEAQEIRQTYDNKAPFVRRLLQHFSNQASLNGLIKTMLKRRRRFNWWVAEVLDLKTGRPVEIMHYSRERPEIEGALRPPKRAYTHKALNAAIQGSAADIMKKAMVDCFEAGLPIPLLTVHDELDFSSSDMAAMRAVRDIMEHCVDSLISSGMPITCDHEIGPNWGDLRAA